MVWSYKALSTSGKRDFNFCWLQWEFLYHMLSQKSEERELVQGSEMSLEFTHSNTHNLITKVMIFKGFYNSQLP